MASRQSDDKSFNPKTHLLLHEHNNFVAMCGNHCSTENSSTKVCRFIAMDTIPSTKLKEKVSFPSFERLHQPIIYGTESNHISPLITPMDSIILRFEPSRPLRFRAKQHIQGQPLLLGTTPSRMLCQDFSKRTGRALYGRVSINCAVPLHAVVWHVSGRLIQC